MASGADARGVRGWRRRSGDHHRSAGCRACRSARVTQSLGDRRGVEGFWHGAEHGSSEDHLVDLLAPKDLDRESDVARVHLGCGLKGHRARSLGLLGRSDDCVVELSPVVVRARGGEPRVAVGVLGQHELGHAERAGRVAIEGQRPERDDARARGAFVARRARDERARSVALVAVPSPPASSSRSTTRPAPTRMTSGVSTSQPDRAPRERSDSRFSVSRADVGTS